MHIFTSRPVRVQLHGNRPSPLNPQCNLGTYTCRQAAQPSSYSSYASESFRVSTCSTTFQSLNFLFEIFQLESQKFILTLLVLKFNFFKFFFNNLGSNMIYTKVVALNRIGNFVVNKFIILSHLYSLILFLCSKISKFKI